MIRGIGNICLTQVAEAEMPLNGEGERTRAGGQQAPMHRVVWLQLPDIELDPRQQIARDRTFKKRSGPRGNPRGVIISRRLWLPGPCRCNRACGVSS